MVNIENKAFLTQKEVAEYLRVSVGTVINRRERGELPFLRFPGSTRVVYPVEGIKAVVEKYSTPAKEVAARERRITAEMKRKKPVVSATDREWRI